MDRGKFTKKLLEWWRRKSLPLKGNIFPPHASFQAFRGLTCMCDIISIFIWKVFSNFHFSTFQKYLSSRIYLKPLQLWCHFEKHSKEHHSVSSSPNNLLPSCKMFLLTSLALLKMPPSLHLISYKYSDHPWRYLPLHPPNPLIPPLLHLL